MRTRPPRNHFSAPQVLRPRAVLALSLAAAFTYAALGMVVPIRVLYVQAHGASLVLIGAMASSYVLSNLLFQYPVSWVADRWGTKRIMVIGLMAQAVLVLVYLAIIDPVLFVILRLGEGVLAATFLSPAQALIADTVPSVRRGEAYGLFSAFYNAGFLLGPAIGGALASMGFASAFVASSLCRLLAAFLIVVLVRLPAHNERAVREETRKSPCASSSLSH